MQVLVWGDPAGMARDAIYEVTAFDFLRTLGLKAQPTPSNDFKVRRESAAAPMQRLINGKPGLMVDSKCKLLRKSLAGGYHFKRVAVGAGQERFRDAPNKNEHSHIGDKLGVPAAVRNTAAERAVLMETMQQQQQEAAMAQAMAMQAQAGAMPEGAM